MAEQYKVEAIFKGDTSDLEKDVSSLEGKLDDTIGKSSQLGDTAKKVGRALAGAFAVKAVIGFGKDVVETTARLDAMKAQFDQVFTGDQNVQALDQLGTASEELGIHVDRLTDSYNKFGAQTKGAGMDATESLEATDKATRLAADSAAFFDRSMEDSTAALASFMKGNFEAGDSIGVFTNAKQMDIRSNEEYGKSWADLSEKERQWLLLDTVEKTYEMNGAMGQAVREAESYENVMGNLNAVWDNFKATIGEPILTGIVIPAMMGLMDIITAVTTAVQGLITWFKEHETTAMVLATVVGALTAALIAYNIQQSAVAIGAKLMAAGTAIATGATTAFGAAVAFLTSPITLAIAAIAAIIAIGVLLYKNWDKVKEMAGKLGDYLSAKWDAVRQWTSEKWDAIKNSISSGINSAKDYVSNKVNEISSAVSDKWNAIKTATSGAWDSVKNKTSEVWGNVKSGITDKLGAARDFVRNAIDKIKSFFNFKWELPKLKMPHFSISGKFSLNPPQIPKIGVDWYAKGGVFDTASVIGVGERGSEAVLPTNKLDNFLRSAVERVRSASSGSASGSVPVNLHLTMGKGTYRAYIEDITAAQDTNLNLDLTYGGVR